MKEARIVMPHDGSPSNTDVHTLLAIELAEAFGGYTTFSGFGGWAHFGELTREHVMIFDIACDENRDYTYDKLFEIAQRAGKALDQQAVYIRYPDGFVEIADVGKTEHHHHPLDIAAREAVEATLDRDAVMQDTGDGRSAIASETDRLYKELTGREHASQSIEKEVNVFRKDLRKKPHVGEIWLARTGELVAVLSQASILDGGYNCVTLTKGQTAVNPGRVFVCGLDGSYGYAGPRDHHPLDLVSYHGNFLVP